MLYKLTAPIVDALVDHLDLPRDQIAPLVAPPTKAGAGDFAIPCFVLAKARKQAPPQVAAELATVLSERVNGCSAQAAGPFCNISLSSEAVSQALFPTLSADPDQALQGERGTGFTVCIDFSSPNIAKHLAFHHIRSTMLGNALANCYAADGWNVKRINFLGDWGTAFGRLIAGWHREGLTLNDLDQADDKITFLNSLYVRISQAADADPAVMEEARSWSKKLEDGDVEARNLWQVFKDASLAEFHRIYELLGVTFDSWKGEAHYESLMAPMLDELRAADLLQEDQGALVVDLSEEGFKKPVLIQRADGGTLYATRDLAAADDRHKEFAFDRALYVVDLGQGLHFKEWFAVANKLGKPWADRLRHIGFGVVLMWNDEDNAFVKGKTRSGQVVLLDDVLSEAMTRAQAIVDEKNPDLDTEVKASVAKSVGVGAVVFNDLKNTRTGDVKFRFEDALNMQGDTGPYVQYTHARLCSIERRFAEEVRGTWISRPELLQRDDEKAVFIAIARLNGALRAVVDHDEPHHLATALLDLAGAASSWYAAGSREPEAKIVLPDDPLLSATRVQLVNIARHALGRGLNLLGLDAPEQM